MVKHSLSWEPALVLLSSKVSRSHGRLHHTNSVHGVTSAYQQEWREVLTEMSGSVARLLSCMYNTRLSSRFACLSPTRRTEHPLLPFTGVRHTALLSAEHAVEHVVFGLGDNDATVESSL